MTPLLHPSDARLVAKAAAGSGEAWAELFARYWRDAFATANRDLESLCRRVVDAVAPDADPAHALPARQHLHALLDGLALHVLHGLAPDEAVAVLGHHLRALAASAGS